MDDHAKERPIVRGQHKYKLGARALLPRLAPHASGGEAEVGEARDLGRLAQRVGEHELRLLLARPGPAPHQEVLEEQRIGPPRLVRVRRVQHAADALLLGHLLGVERLHLRLGRPRVRRDEVHEPRQRACAPSAPAPRPARPAPYSTACGAAPGAAAAGCPPPWAAPPPSAHALWLFAATPPRPSAPPPSWARAQPAAKGRRRATSGIGARAVRLLRCAEFMSARRHVTGGSPRPGAGRRWRRCRRAPRRTGGRRWLARRVRGREGRAWGRTGDYVGDATRAVGEARGDGQLALLALAHAEHALLPACSAQRSERPRRTEGRAAPGMTRPSPSMNSMG